MDKVYVVIGTNSEGILDFVDIYKSKCEAIAYAVDGFISKVYAKNGDSNGIKIIYGNGDTVIIKEKEIK